MKVIMLVVLSLALTLMPCADATETSPISKILQLLSDLQGKIEAEGANAKSVYGDFTHWCEETSANLGYDIKTGKSEIAKLMASIEDEKALSASLNTKVDELTVSINTDEADLKAASGIRAKESADFGAEDKELTEVIGMLERAINIIEREMQKGGAAMLQLKGAQNVEQALMTLVQASVFSSADATRLTALMQSSQASQDNDDDMSLGAPAAAVYESHSASITDTLNGILEKAETQLADARKQEMTGQHNFELLKQSLEDDIKFANKDMAKAKLNLAASGEKKAGAEGELAMAQKDLAADTNSLADTTHDCLTKAEDFEAATKSRQEELTALSEAKKAISENTGGAAQISYGLNQVSLLQVASSKMSSGMDLANFEAVRFVRDLARKHESSALAQLASRMASAIRTNDDPFSKVKGLIGDMIERLESEASADASEKAFCDKELGESNAKHADMSAEIAKLTASIDQMVARSAALKAEVAALQKSLAQLASRQAEMNKLRTEEHAAFVSNKADMEQGLEGIKMALKVLRDYYSNADKAHEGADGAANGIIGLIEVAESDFTKDLAEIVATEQSAVAAVDEESKANQIDKSSKGQDVKYKNKEASALEKAIAETSSDRSNVQAELDAVVEYLGQLKERCIAKAETYASRAARGAAEIAGLKEALEILENETALLQQGTVRKTLRGRAKQLAPGAV